MISIQGISKNFGAFKALDNINLEVPGGELVALLGPSGSGKTTLLRILAGLEQPDSGSVLLDGKDMTDENTRERGVGFVFQHYALFRHMSIFDNVAYGLTVKPRSQRLPKKEISERVYRLLKLVQLDYVAKRTPDELSGGQRQRIALARALAVEPKYLLLDEPFGALDAKVRRELRERLRRLHDEIHVTSVFVTHDQEEAFEVSDRVAVLNEGRIEEFGKPSEIYENTRNPFVLKFFGDVTFLPAKRAGNLFYMEGIIAEAPADFSSPQNKFTACVRPYEWVLSRAPLFTQAEGFRITHILPWGAAVKIEAERENSPLKIRIEISRRDYLTDKWQEGEKIFLSPQRYELFSRQPGDFKEFGGQSSLPTYEAFDPAV